MAPVQTYSTARGLIFRQLFEPLSSTFTYLIGCAVSGEAALIDPAYPTWERDLAILRSLGLKLTWTLETHVHADHITAARRLKAEVGSRIAAPAVDQLPCADLGITEEQALTVGRLVLAPLYTPGHTDDHFCYRIDDRVLTGDALLIDGCGRTDFQNGDAATLYRSIHDKLYQLPDDTLVYPGHDYSGRRVSSIAQEKQRNARIPVERSLEDFTALMNGLSLPYPKFIDHAVPGNRQCGVCPADLPDNLKHYCGQMTASIQG